MKTSNSFLQIAVAVLLSALVSSCEAIGTIFEAGVWSGILLVVGGILLLVFLVTRLMGGKKG
jgi:hypothetical protein